MTACAALATAAISVASAGATEVVYDNIPSPVPGNLPSQGFEATATSELGGLVQIAGSARRGSSEMVGLSSWACQSGSWNAENCVSAPGSSYELPITFNLYAVGPGNTVGAKLYSVTHIEKVPYRPSASAKCTGAQAGEWYLATKHECFNGKLFRKVTMLPGLIVPADGRMIVSLAFNTSDYGAAPLGPQPCSATAAGCPYDSLNLATTSAAPTVGSDPLPEDAFISSTNEAEYCGSGAAVGTFAISTGCWSGYQPLITLKAH